MSTSKQDTGKRGEQLAATYLRQRGYAIVQMNWRCPQGEIDIIARRDGELVFVEVRSRRAASTETAFESVSARKRERLVRAVHAYLNAHHLPTDSGWRVDVIAVALSAPSAERIAHVEDALDW